MNDERRRKLLAEVLAKPRRGAAYRALAAHAEALSGERPGDPALGEILAALAKVADAGNDDAAHLRYLGLRAEWAEARFGAASPEALQAWALLADRADEAYDFDLAIDAWRRIVATPLPEDAPERLRRNRCDSLRGLGARHLTGRPDIAYALFEEELTCRERLDGAGGSQFAISLANLAAAAEALGRPREAADLHRRQLPILERELGGGHGTVAALRSRIAALGGD